jgi:uncharacterized protein (DUF1810 family)
MPDEFSHFIAAQNPVYDQVIQELANGQKQSHWMWFVFPQVAGLGRSPMAQQYALHSLDAARRYIAHPVLGERLRQCTRLVVGTHDRTALEIFGNPDELKFHSSMTLFALAAPQEPLFAAALAKYFNRRADVKTLEILWRQRVAASSAHRQ